MPDAPFRPPRLARWLFEVLLPPEYREAVLGDLAEEFDERCRKGRIASGRDGQHIPVTNLDSDTLGTSVVFHDGLTYTEDHLTLFGELVDGSLIVDNLVAR